MEHYILDEAHEIKLATQEEWIEWSRAAYESHEGFERLRRVAFTQIDGDCHVSTVFLGIDHSFMLQGPPVLFETMVFGGDLDQEQDRYHTWQEAEAGHAAIVARILA